jgi:apolipoprotein N-acyltransferase
LEYFRSELYYLRFSWLNAGYAFAENMPFPLFGLLGMYGIGFAAMAIAAVFSLRSVRVKLIAAGVAAALAGTALLQDWNVSEEVADDTGKSVSVGGVQLEFPLVPEAVSALDALVKAAPDAELLVLSEYTFDGPVPEKIKLWCREHRRYLVVGGKEPASKDNFYDTAFVIGPAGDIVFRQVKAVPIQFFNDGLPAPEQKLWESPWGKIGICVCYDLSYTRVTDRLIHLGAEALVVPTMDVADWGKREHELHARVAPVRAAEYNVPIFRVASSGVSQLVNHSGRVTAAAPFPGESTMISGRLNLHKPGSLPFDRWLAPLATGVTAVLCLWLLFNCRTTKPIESPNSENRPEQALQKPLNG